MQGGINGDFVAHLECTDGTLNAELDRLKDKTCDEERERFPHYLEEPDPKSDSGVPAHALVTKSWYV